MADEFCFYRSQVVSESARQRLATFTYACLVPRLFGNATIGNRYLGNAPIFFVYVVYEFNAYSSRHGSSWASSGVFIAVTWVETSLALSGHAYVSRSIDMKTSPELPMDLLTPGIGGYEFLQEFACVSLQDDVS